MEDQLLAQTEILQPLAELKTELADLESAKRLDDALQMLKKEMEPAVL